HDVEQDQVRPVAADPLDRLGAVSCLGDPDARRFETDPTEKADGWVVVDDDDRSLLRSAGVHSNPSLLLTFAVDQQESATGPCAGAKRLRCFGFSRGRRTLDE